MEGGQGPQTTAKRWVWAGKLRAAVGDAPRCLPRNWIRQYPALVNCTTINWFSEWPREALLEVAEKYIVGVDLGQQENVSLPPDTPTFLAALGPQPAPLTRLCRLQIHRKVAQIFVTMHWSVAQYSQKMLLELRRYNYVTPTNYLELVSGYKKYEDQRQGGPGSQYLLRVLTGERLPRKMLRIWQRRGH